RSDDAPSIPSVLLHPNLWQDFIFDDTSNSREVIVKDAPGSVGNLLGFEVRRSPDGNPIEESESMESQDGNHQATKIPTDIIDPLQVSHRKDVVHRKPRSDPCSCLYKSELSTPFLFRSYVGMLKLKCKFPWLKSVNNCKNKACISNMAAQML